MVQRILSIFLSKAGWTARYTLIGLIALGSLACEDFSDVPSSSTNQAVWRTDPRAVVDLNQFTPGAGNVTAQPWDIGTGINAYVWQAPNPRAIVLLHHGYGEYAFRFVNQYSQLIPRLLNMGISVYALDGRGHGYSPGNRGLIDVERAVADHLVARALLKKQSLPVFIMGHSLGGLITASSLVKTQEGLAGVITMGAALYYDENSLLTRFLTQSVAAFAPRASLLSSADSDEDLYRGASTDPVFQNDKLVYRGEIPVKTLATTLKLTKQNPAYYSRITIPALILHGTDDQATNPQGSQNLYDAISSTDKTLKLVAGGHHELLNDEKKAEVLTLVLTWLEDRI